VITINTILSKKDLQFIEAIIAEHGYIVNIAQIKSMFSNMTHDELHQRIKLLVKRGWLIRIKQGYYALANLESHSYSNISPLAISRVFIPQSYVSFEYALNYHGYFDQLPGVITSVTSKKSKKYRFQNTDYHFVKAKERMMTGYKEVNVAGIGSEKANIAEIEKALIDHLHFRKDRYTVDLVLEKFLEIGRSIDHVKMIKMAFLYSISTQRRLGFLMDLSNLDSAMLHKQIKGIAGFARLTKKSTTFNSKWRIYYENRFVEQSTAFFNQ
jgi:predicted transcriptional regulator of viral defense system